MRKAVNFDAERFLLSREQFGMRFGLERMRGLLALLGDPDSALPAMHVVGTNGKSSTTRFAAAALGAQGLTVGTFTSPHLVGFFERVTVSGAPLADARFAAAALQVSEAVEQLDAASAADDRVTQFEAAWAVALCAFRAAGCDAIVVEAGLGGRLDATNVLRDSRVQVLTGVGLDHTDLLGDTVAAIAAEKLAVVREGAVLVVGSLPAELQSLAARTAIEHGARLEVAAGKDQRFAGIPGAFMRANATLALIAAAEFFATLGRPSPKHFDRSAAAAAIIATSESGLLHGRLSVEGEAPLVVFDCAHNAQAAAELVSAIDELAGERDLTLVIGLLADKQTSGLVAALAARAHAVVCTQPSNPRALAAQELARIVATEAPSAAVSVEQNPHLALEKAQSAAGPQGAVLVTGSNYLIADLVRGDTGQPAATF